MTTELATRAVACRHWRWMPGMLTDNDNRLSTRLVNVATPSPRLRGCLPVLDDPATIGCLLALVREAWETQRANCYMVHPEDDWGCNVQVYEVSGLFRGPTEAHALVAALEGASRRNTTWRAAFDSVFGPGQQTSGNQVVWSNTCTNGTGVVRYRPGESPWRYHITGPWGFDPSLHPLTDLNATECGPCDALVTIRRCAAAAGDADTASRITTALYALGAPVQVAALEAAP